MNDYSKDLAICEAATPGPWGFAEQSGLILAGGTLIGDARFLSDGEFIAKFNPSHMIERIKREQAKDERIGELEASLNASQMENEELGAHMERLMMHIDHLCFTCVHEGNPCNRTAKGFTTSCCSDYKQATPAQSLQAIRAETEVEVINKIVDLCRVEVESSGYKFGESIYTDKNLPEIRAGNYDKIGQCILGMARKYS